MSVTSVGSSDSQSVSSALLQQILAGGSTSQGSGSLSSALSDLLNLSSASQQLAKAPAAVTQAMNDLMSTQKDVTGDLAQLKSYFQANPNSLNSVLSALQGGSSTYDSSGTVATRSSALAALQGTQATADPLLASLGLSNSGSSSSVLSLLG